MLDSDLIEVPLVQNESCAVCASMRPGVSPSGGFHRTMSLQSGNQNHSILSSPTISGCQCPINSHHQSINTIHGEVTMLCEEADMSCTGSCRFRGRLKRLLHKESAHVHLLSNKRVKSLAKLAHAKIGTLASTTDDPLLRHAAQLPCLSMHRQTDILACVTQHDVSDLIELSCACQCLFVWPLALVHCKDCLATDLSPVAHSLDPAQVDK